MPKGFHNTKGKREIYNDDGNLAYRCQRPKVIQNLNTDLDKQRRSSSTLYEQEYSYD